MNIRFVLRRVLRILLWSIACIIAGFIILFFAVTGEPEWKDENKNVVNDVTRMNPVSVGEVTRPETLDEVKSLVENSHGSVSIGGARHSMGGQIGTEGSLHLDMRGFNHILRYDSVAKEITVESGVTWRMIQERIDKDDLSVAIMQTYADFTVGGSLSVNVHGRYIGTGPVIYSVKSFKVVLADGTVVQASPELNPEIFYGCIGGYGGLGVIVEITLMLTDNCKVARGSMVMPAKDYVEFFKSTIRSDTAVVFHNADLYPGNFDQVRAVSFTKTNKEVTVEDRLKPTDRNYRIERFAMWMVSEFPGGKWIREHWADPLYYRSNRVEWRNFEASFNAMELEPSSRNNYTYVLQEYFVPVRNFGSFVPVMAEIFQKHDVNVINVSIRHAKKDPGSMLAWAKEEVFCFVVYYKQQTTDEARKEVGIWTREMIDAAIANEGSYYLPYQIHATPDQFMRAYPGAGEFFELKKKLDPSNKFRNKLWDAYYRPAS